MIHAGLLLLGVLIGFVGCIAWLCLGTKNDDADTD